jgi:hypothetical protein
MDLSQISSNAAAAGACGILAVLVVLLFFWTWAVSRRAGRLQAQLDQLLGDASNPAIGQLLAEYLTTVRATASTVERMRAEHDELVRVVPSMLRHIGLVRFSPFHDTGGDQSFALALLDGLGNGVVITGLHSRHDSRLYAKPIERHTSPYSLTPEEREAMDQATSRTPVSVR